MHTNLRIEEPALSPSQSMHCAVQFLTVYIRELHFVRHMSWLEVGTFSDYYVKVIILGTYWPEITSFPLHLYTYSDLIVTVSKYKELQHSSFKV